MCVCTLGCLSRARLCDPMDCSPPGSSVHGILQEKKVLQEGDRVGGTLSSRGSSGHTSPALHVDSSPAEPLGKPFLKDICLSIRIIWSHKMKACLISEFLALWHTANEVLWIELGEWATLFAQRTWKKSSRHSGRRHPALPYPAGDDSSPLSKAWFCSQRMFSPDATALSWKL